MKSLWKFAEHGQSGRWVSELFPEMARHVDDLCHSLNATEGIAHGPATLFCCGSTISFDPPWALVDIWLGHGDDNLPLRHHQPLSGNGGARNYGNAFCPRVSGRSPGTNRISAAEATIRNLSNPSLSPAEQKRQSELCELRGTNEAARGSRARRGD
jgi:hypothetical protein